MPYIGNNHIAGDHTNNFKVLDDISSYTATFDGSATSVVDTTNNTIRVVEHRFIQGQRVTYTNGGGGNIGGLTTGTAYFVIFDSASTFKLATSASNAANSTAINLSAVGTGSSHTINAAFDGVNTKFKLTHSTGTGARLNNATQVNVAINNVLQKPNQSASYTEGFIIEDNHKIAFKTAPTSEDIFWGSIIANTLTTFDISDHKIDTFTGDGSTTEFTLSHTPANNESLMVTINGVLQHPSNASTARAYTLIASIIQFTAAPGVGDEIQVRHMGFAGATTADVSGFYGRTGNVVLTSNDHITTGNINAGIVTATSFNGSFSPNIGGSNANFTGIVTAGVFKSGDFDGRNLNISGIATFAGDVSIGGTLTYEDVTNIDSVGIITAQKDIHVGAGLSVVGVTTTTDDINIDADNKKLQIGDGQDIKLYHNSGNSFIENSTGYLLVNSSGGDTVIRSNNDVYLQPASGEHAVKANANGGVELFYDQNNHTTAKLITSATGVTIDGTAVAGGLDISGDIDVDGHTNLDNVSIAGVTTFSTSPVVPNGGYYKGIINSGSQQKIVGGYISGSNTLRLGESMYLTMNPERLGLGINDPQRTLHLSSNNTVIALTDTAAGTNQKTKYILSDAGVFAVGKLSDDYNTATEHLYIDNDGHVIINRGGNGGTADVNADNFVIKNYTSSSSCGISILNADNQNSTLYFGNASDSKHAEVVWSDASNLFLIGTSNAGASIKFRTANQSDALTINSSGNLSVLYDLDVDGHTNLDNVNIAGVSTFASNVDIDGSTYFGASGTTSPAADFSLTSNGLVIVGSQTVIEARKSSNATIQCTETTNNTDLQLRANASGGLVRTASNTALNLGTFQKNRIQITNDGKVQIGLPGSSTSLPGAVEVVNIRAMTDGNLIVRAIGSISGAPSGSGVGIDVLNDANNAVKDLALRGSTVIFKGASDETLRISSDGNIGINDNGPPNFTGYKSLSIHGSTGGALVFGDDGTDEWETYGGDGVFKIYDRAATTT